MNIPANIEIPFFAYGLFRPGQLAFFQLREFIINITDPVQVSGNLLVRDGMPIIDLDGHGSVTGVLVTFLSEQATLAYERISALKPGKHYRWHEARVEGKPANILVGRSPNKGSVPYEYGEWNGWDDPLFTVALEIVEESLTSNDYFQWDLKPLFRLQMAYLLLWSSIERYVSLRYHLGDNVMKKINKLACEPVFAEGLLQHVKKPRLVYRADRPGHKVVLDPQFPKKSLAYYYQVRSNMAHRGKGVASDYERVKISLVELLPIFRKVLVAAELDSRFRPTSDPSKSPAIPEGK